MEEELLLLEQQVRRNDAEMEEEEFWQNKLQIEQKSEQQLRPQLVELQGQLRNCEDKLSEHLAGIQVSEAALRRRITVNTEDQSLKMIVCLFNVLQSMEAGLEQERLQQEADLNQRVNEEQVAVCCLQSTQNQL